MRTIQSWNAAGKGPPRDSDGTYPCEAIGDWLRNEDRAAQGLTESGEVYNYDVERARLTKNQADEKELQVAILRGDLIPAEVVSDDWAQMINAMRARLLSMPTKLAPTLVACSDFREVESAIKQQVIESLLEITDDISQGTTESVGNRSESSITPAELNS